MKKKRPQRTGSWLTRFFKSEDKRSKRREKRPARQAAAPPPSEPLSPRQKAVAEIRQLAAIGRKDPERLAMLLTNMLGEAREGRRRDEEKYRALIEEIARRDGERA